MHLINMKEITAISADQNFNLKSIIEKWTK